MAEIQTSQTAESKSEGRRPFFQSTAGVVLVLALLFAAALMRLVLIDRGDKPLTEEDAERISKCLPRLELQALSAVTLLPVDSGSQTSLTLHTVGLLQVQDQLTGSLPSEGQTIALKGKHLTLRKTNGDFQLHVPESAKLRMRSAGATLQLVGPARLGPSSDIVYEVDVPEDSKLVATVRGSGPQAQALVDPDREVGHVTIGAGLSATTTQPLSLQRIVEASPQELFVTTASSHAGLGNLAIGVGALRRSNDSATTNFVACVARIASKESATWTRVSVDAAAGSGDSLDRADLLLPEALRPKFLDLAVPLRIAVTTLDGKVMAVGSTSLVGRAAAAAAATVATALLFGIVMYQHGVRRQERDGRSDARWLSGLFVGIDGQPSLSLLQVFFWTLVTVWGMAYVFVASGQLLSLTLEMMQLLGLAGFSSVLARWLGASGRSTSAPAAKDEDKPTAVDNDFFRMLSSNGEFDLMKLQLFIFSVLIGIYVVSRIFDAAAFPALDSNMLLLMGVSQGVYVTSKWSSATPLAKAQGLLMEVDVQASVVEQLKAKTPPATSEEIKAANDKLTALQTDCDKALASLRLKRS